MVSLFPGCGNSHENHRHRNPRLSRPDAKLDFRQSPHRPERPVGLGRGNAGMAHSGSRRGDRRPGLASGRRRPDAHRASLADDVSPAFLARQRHRARHGHQRHRHRAVGHPGQDSRRAVPQAVGRAGARHYPHLLPPGRRQDGRFLRGRSGRRRPLRRAGPASRERGLHRLQVDGRAGDHAHRRPAAGPLRRSLRARDARGGRRRRSTSWSTATPGPRRGWA